MIIIYILKAGQLNSFGRIRRKISIMISGIRSRPSLR